MYTRYIWVQNLPQRAYRQHMPAAGWKGKTVVWNHAGTQWTRRNRGKDCKASAGHSSEKYARKTAEKETYRFSGTFRKERGSQTDSYDPNLSFFSYIKECILSGFSSTHLRSTRLCSFPAYGQSVLHVPFAVQAACHGEPSVVCRHIVCWKNLFMMKVSNTGFRNER